MICLDIATVFKVIAAGGLLVLLLAALAALVATLGRLNEDDDEKPCL